jgi:hypothetical protein
MDHRYVLDAAWVIGTELWIPDERFDERRVARWPAWQTIVLQVFIVSTHIWEMEMDTIKYPFSA